MPNEGTIIRSALGRIAKLGDLYDARSDEFCGISMFNGNISDKFVTTTDNPSNRTEFVSADTLEKKAHLINISGELSLSIACLPVGASWSAKFLQDQRSIGRCVRMTCLCEVTTKVEQLGLFHEKLKQYIASNAVKNQNATHVVVEVIWGDSVYLSVDINSDKISDECRRDGNAALLLKIKEAIIKATTKTSFEWDDTTKSLAKGTNVKLYSDILPDGSDELPITFEEACTQVRQLRARISNINDGKGKPISYKMFPMASKELIDHFDIRGAHIAALYRPIEEATLMVFVQLFNEILVVKEVINEFADKCNKYRKYLPDDAVTEATQLRFKLAEGEDTLQRQMAAALKQYARETRTFQSYTS